MAAIFEGGGLRFLYPENWRVEEEATVDGWSVTVQSPETAFMLISVYPTRPAVRQILDTTLAAMREDAPDLETEEAEEEIAHRRAVGHDIHFFSLDLTNTAWTRGFRTRDKTVLILSQATDLELEYAEPVLRAIRASLEVTDETTTQPP